MNEIMAFLDGYVLPNHQYSGQNLVIIALALLLVLLFEVWMLLDVLEYRKVPVKSRVAWVVGMFVVHPFVALAYFFVRSRYKLVK